MRKTSTKYRPRQRTAGQGSVQPVASPWPDYAVWLVLAFAILLVYAQAGQFAFINYDDPEYLTDNPQVQAGLTLASIKYAFTAVVSANWMPVTLLSHMSVVDLFGLSSGAHHLFNVFFHLLAAILLFVCLRRTTDAYWPSAFVAFLFAVHPLHVESVAWVSERKDVLCGFFWFFALWAYIRYTERPDVRRYLLMFALVALGLMSKPMMVTFPFALLLFDFWPLRRAQFPKAVVEKLPLFALSAASSVVTWMVQRGAVQDALPLAFRIREALSSYLLYLIKTFWPAGLAMFYPLRNVSLLEAGAAAIALIVITAAAFAFRRDYPYLLTGWLWYLGTLVPVIGLVQVGGQSMADRYTYIPSVGLFIMVAWGAMDLYANRPRWKTSIVTAAAVACLVPMALAAKQASYWLNDETLYRHAIAVTKDNYVAEINLATILGQTGRGAEAIPLFEAAVKQVPGDAKIHNSLGILLSAEDHTPDAISQFEAAVRLRPDFFEAQYNLATLLMQIPGRKEEALAHFEAAQKLNPRPSIAHTIEQLRGH